MLIVKGSNISLNQTVVKQIGLVIVDGLPILSVVKASSDNRDIGDAG